jgi:hypothetical protein
MSASNGTGLLTNADWAEAPATPQWAADHWALRVDTPFRSPAEIGELALGHAPAGLGSVLTEGFADAAFEIDHRSRDPFERAESEYEDYEEGAHDEGEEGEEEYLPGSDLLEETPAAEHPLAAVLSLPRLAFDAMSKGVWGTAIAVALGAGFRDVNKLTNMVFWYRHPEQIGQKIHPDQRDLAREWLDIRDRIVKPALAGSAGSGPAPSSVALPATTTDPSSTASSSGAQGPIPGDRLKWANASDDQLRFMRAVYDAHIAWAKRGGRRFVPDLPDDVLGWVDDGNHHRMRKDAAAEARAMLAAAEAQLRREGRAGRTRIGIRSAYRTATEQFSIWQGYGTGGGFPAYYDQTRATRPPNDPHGPKAVQILMKHMRRFVAAPGYSNHQHGTAVDLSTREGPGRLVKLYEGSWFHNWLKENAKTFHFHPLESEAWHWYYVPPKGGAGEIGEAETWASPALEAFESETPGGIRAGRYDVPKVSLLAGHRGQGADLILRWNDMPAAPTEIDVAVHLHGYTKAVMTLEKNIIVWSGLDLAPVDGKQGSGRSRPTLTVLPRGHATGIRSQSGLYRYTFPALTTRDGMSALIQVALGEFAGRVGIQPPKLARLIFTAHSGGGAPLMKILCRHEPHEVHVFDGLYQDATALAEWAALRIKGDRAAVVAGGGPAGAMRVFFGSSTRGYSERLAAALAPDLTGAPQAIVDRYRVEATTLGHMQIPRQYGWRILADPAADVPDARRAGPSGAIVKPRYEFAEAASALQPETLEEQFEEGESPFMSESLEETLDEDEFEDIGALEDAGEFEFGDEGAAVNEAAELGEDEDEGSATEGEAGIHDSETATAESVYPTGGSAARADTDFLGLAGEIAQLGSEIDGSPAGGPGLELSQFIPNVFAPPPPSASADITVAVPAFGALERVKIPVPVLNAAQSASAIRWNTNNHPGTSGVDPNHIRTDLARYISPTAVAVAIVAFNVRNPSAPIAAGTPPIDAVFVESVHQFQAKCFFETKSQVDGLAGESTLDSLGIVKRTGMNSVDRANPGAVSRLRNVDVPGETGNEFTANDWFNSMVNPTFLGWRFKGGVHLTFARKLRVAEKALLAQATYRGKTPVELGAALGFSATAQEHKGARPTATSRSMHTYGLAADILYSQNPWVRGNQFTAALKDAAKLVSGVAITENTSQEFFHNIRAGRTSAQIFDLLAQRNQDFETLLALVGDTARLEALLGQRRADGTAGVFNSPAETIEQAARRWEPVIRGHRDAMRSTSSPFRQDDGSLRDPARGFLNLHRDLVIALRDDACLAWGAVDIGTGADGNGDMMHFDARACGLGDLLAQEGRNARVRADHPCVPCVSGGI